MKTEDQPTGSELAALLQQIDIEARAANAAIYGFRSGASRHDFITARMARTRLLATQLIQAAGSDAIPAIISTLDQALTLGNQPPAN